MREAVSSLIGQAGGIVSSGDLQLQQNGTPNMSVNVTAGRAWIPNTFLSAVSTATGTFYPGGMYYTENDATVNLGVSASSTLNPRVDQVVVQVQDASYSGASNLVQPVVLTGTPTSGASLANLVGLASVPASSLLLGYVLVPANASTVTTGNISNVVGLVGVTGLTGAAWTGLTLGTNIGNAGSAYPGTARVFGDRVQLRGVIQNNNVGTVGASSVIANVPSTCRPASTVSPVAAFTSGFIISTAVIVNASGQMTLGQNWGAGIGVALDGLSYSLA